MVMFDRIESIVNHLRTDEYTGSNRCIPCTAVNVGIAVIVSVLAGVVAIELGVLVFIASLLIIYVRGYLVPGTPTLTKRYLPDRILAAFEKGPRHTDPETVTDSDGPELELAKQIQYAKKHRVDPDTFLVEIGALTPDTGAERELTGEFSTLVNSHVKQAKEDGVSIEDIATLFDVERDRIENMDREYPAFKVIRRIRKWPAEGSLVTDVGTDRALRVLNDRWDEVPMEQRLNILESLRLFTETCPNCDGPISITDETFESCCRVYPVVQLRCEACDLTVTELDPNEVETETVDWDLSGDPGVLRQV